MESGSQFLEIVLLVAVAGFIFLRLRSVLGRRMGHEQSPREEQNRRPAEGHKARDLDDAPRADDKVVVLGDKTRTVKPSPFAFTPLQRALSEIHQMDRSFDEGTFLEGAEAAYEMIVVAFAKGDKEMLKDLLSKEVYNNFAASIEARSKDNLTMSTDIVAIHSAEITEATLEQRDAEITVAFEAEMISMTKNEDGVVVAGDPQPDTVNELWTFARTLKSRNPNWLLIATRSAQ
ncbi:MAG: Tim44 domain-containing protein [Alphaproteobacteria bacterium]|nr:MAG: Tim44 domain-containing protein [Alphaproteobacteria bacterium]